MKQPTHFIEQFKREDGRIESTAAMNVKNLEWSLKMSARHNITTIAIFKIYPK